MYSVVKWCIESNIDAFYQSKSKLNSGVWWKNKRNTCLQTQTLIPGEKFRQEEENTKLPPEQQQNNCSVKKMTCLLTFCCFQGYLVLIDNTIYTVATVQFGG